MSWEATKERELEHGKRKTRDWSKPLDLEIMEADPRGIGVADEVVFDEFTGKFLPTRPITHHFRGAGVETDQDELRLDSQYNRILRLMSDGRFRTLAEISAITHDPEGSILRQLSYMDDPQCGGHKKNKQRRGPGRGLWEYSITLNPQYAENRARRQFHASWPGGPNP